MDKDRLEAIRKSINRSSYGDKKDFEKRHEQIMRDLHPELFKKKDEFPLDTKK